MLLELTLTLALLGRRRHPWRKMLDGNSLTMPSTLLELLLMLWILGLKMLELLGWNSRWQADLLLASKLLLLHSGLSLHLSLRMSLHLSLRMSLHRPLRLAGHWLPLHGWLTLHLRLALH